MPAMSDPPPVRKRRRPPLRRKTVRWSAREVDALLAGVRLHGVGKWAAILRTSCVFNGVRTSVDLKDKWRNLTSPMRAAALGDAEPGSPVAEREGGGGEGSQSHSQSQSQSDEGEGYNEGGGVVPPSESSVSPDVLAMPGSLTVRSLPSPPPSDWQVVRAPPAPPPPEPPAAPTSPSPPRSPSPSSSPTSQPPHRPRHADAPVPNALQAQTQSLLQSAAAYPYPSPNVPQVAAMQHVYGQSLYHSAAVLAAQWRRMGIEPTPYSIAAALTSPTMSSSLGGYYAGGGPCAYLPQAGDDDDDDDDDDDYDDEDEDNIHAPGRTYAFPYRGPYAPFLNSFMPASQVVAPRADADGTGTTVPHRDDVASDQRKGPSTSPAEGSGGSGDQAQKKRGPAEKGGDADRDGFKNASGDGGGNGQKKGEGNKCKTKIEPHKLEPPATIVAREPLHPKQEAVDVIGAEASPERVVADVEFADSSGEGLEYFAVEEFPVKGQKDSDQGESESVEEDQLAPGGLSAQPLGFVSRGIGDTLSGNYM